MVEQQATEEKSKYEGKSRDEMEAMFVEMAQEYLKEKDDVPIVTEDPERGFVLR